MPRITVRPADVTIEARTGETIMEAARAAGYYWPTTCGGQGECATCAGLVEEGAANLSEMGRSEAAAIVQQRGRRALETPLRLCCQARLHGDVTVRKPGVKPW